MMNLIKVILFVTLGLFSLVLALYIGGIRIYNGSENLVVIYKYPSLQKIYIYRCPHEGDEGNKHYSDFYSKNIHKVWEVRELSNLQDIEITFYILLVGGMSLFFKAFLIINKLYGQGS